jgi:hypothetical protein
MAGKARKRTPVVPLNDTDFEAGDLTEHTMPEGTPTNPDGTVASPGTVIDVAQAKRIGAVTSDAAQTNKSMARRMDRKAKGETNVPWNENRALHLFDAVRGTFAPSTILVCIKDLETQIDHKPVPMQVLKSSADLYDHVAKHCQRGKTSRTYEIIFKDIHQFSNRGQGTLTMPDLIEESPAAAPQQQAPWMPPGPQYGGGMGGGGGYGYPGGYPSGGGYYPPQPQQPVQAPVQAAATPSVQQPTYQQPQQIVIPPGTDPAIAQMLQSLHSEQRLSREANVEFRTMLAGALGGLEEFRRASYQQASALQHAPPAPPAPQPVQQVAPPPAPPQPSALVFLGYGPAGQPLWGYPPGASMPGQPAGPWNPPQGVGAPPPAPQQAAPQQQVVPPPPSPAAAQRPASLGDVVQMIQSSISQINDVKKALGIKGQTAAEEGDDEGDEVPPPPPPPPDPVKVTTFGDPNDPNALRVAHNTETGELDIGTTIIGNAPGILNMITKSIDAATKLSQAADQAQRARPITVQGHAVPMQQRMVPMPPQPLPPRQM